MFRTLFSILLALASGIIPLHYFNKWFDQSAQMWLEVLFTPDGLWTLIPWMMLLSLTVLPFALCLLACREASFFCMLMAPVVSVIVSAVAVFAEVFVFGMAALAAEGQLVAPTIVALFALAVGISWIVGLFAKEPEIVMVAFLGKK